MANVQQQVEQPNFQVIAQAFNQMGVACNTASTEVAKFGHLPPVADSAAILTAIDNLTTQVAALSQRFDNRIAAFDNRITTLDNRIAAVDNRLREGLEGITRQLTIA